MKKGILIVAFVMILFSQGARESMPVPLAVFVTCPGKTEMRASSNSKWLAASVGDTLYQGYEARCLEDTIAYEVDVFEKVLVSFPDSITEVISTNQVGTVQYSDSSNTWGTMPEDQSIHANGVRTSDSSSTELGIYAKRTRYGKDDSGREVLE